MVNDQLDLIDATPPAARRRAGQYARATQRRLAHRAIVKVTAALSLLVLAIALLGFGWATCGIEVAVVVCIVSIDQTASALVERWGRGAAGEELVGEALDGLRKEGWFALHDVQLGHGNIDHVLVGPAGIFTIATKSHRGRLRANAIDGRVGNIYVGAVARSGLRGSTTYIDDSPLRGRGDAQQRRVRSIPAPHIA